MHLTIHGFHAAKHVADNLNGVQLGQFVRNAIRERLEKVHGM